MHIDLGTNVDAGWVNQIAVSHNGTDWSTIHKDNIASIGRVRIANVQSVDRGAPHQDLEKVHITKTDNTKFSFDIKDVQNQATWSVGGNAALNTAIDDLSTWTA